MFQWNHEGNGSLFVYIVHKAVINVYILPRKMMSLPCRIQESVLRISILGRKRNRLNNKKAHNICIMQEQKKNIVEELMSDLSEYDFTPVKQKGKSKGKPKESPKTMEPTIKPKAMEPLLEGFPTPPTPESERKLVTAEDIAKDRVNRGYGEAQAVRCYGCTYVSRTLDPHNCEWAYYGRILVPLGDHYQDELQNKKKKMNDTLLMRKVRFKLYCKYTWLKWGITEMDDRYPLPTCVEAEIKCNFPDPKGNFSFFKQAKRAKK